MKIINTTNPAQGCADFALLCDHCGCAIGNEPANIEFSNLGEAYCLHKYCSDAFRHKLGEWLFWVGLDELRLTTGEALTKCEINLTKGHKTMKAKAKIKEPQIFEKLCKELWKIVVKHGNIPPWKREELCQEHDHLTEKQLDFLTTCINGILPEVLQELDDLRKAGDCSRWLEAWRNKYADSNDIVSQLLDIDELNEVHEHARWLDEWKRKNGLTVI